MNNKHFDEKQAMLAWKRGQEVAALTLRRERKMRLSKMTAQESFKEFLTLVEFYKSVENVNLNLTNGLQQELKHKRSMAKIFAALNRNGKVH